MADSTRPPATPQGVFASMQKDRLVQIYVGDTTDPILIQQTRITKVADYFRAVFTNEGFEEAKTGVLRLPEDDLEAWQLFMYWLDSGLIWDEAEIIPLMKCWNLGDKYGVSQLQDDVMWVIFQEEDWENCPMFDSMQELFHASPPGSRLRQFLAEQVVLVLDDCSELFSDSRWDKLREDPHFCKELCAAMTAIHKKKDDPRGWGTRVSDDGAPAWMRYMVGSGPKNEGNASLDECYWIKDEPGWLKVKPVTSESFSPMGLFD